MNSVRVTELIDRFFDCDLAGDDRTSLERTLLSSPQARALFWQKAETHALLRKWGRSHWGKVAAASASRDIRRQERTVWGDRPWPRAGRAAALAIGGSALAVLCGFALVSRIGGLAPIGDTPANSGPVAAAGESAAYAALSAAFEPVWADSNVGLMLQRGSLPAGPLELVSGRVELLFASGGTAVIEGPAIVEPLAGNALRLSAGSIRCRCPEPGTELRVETPTSTITDLGTEFAVNVEPGVRTRIGVIEGKVRVDAAHLSHLITNGSAITVDADGRTAEDIGFWRDFATKATLLPFDAEAFTRGKNILLSASFEPVTVRVNPHPALAPSAGRHDGALGPWLGSAGFVDIVGHPTSSGSHAVRIRAGGTPFWPLVWQQIDVDNLAGKMVLASIHAMRTHDDPLVDPQRAIVKLHFVDAAGREFASAERHFLDSNGPIDRFVEGKLAAEAPPGAVAVRFQVLLNAAGLPTGSIIIDDAKLVIANRP